MTIFIDGDSFKRWKLAKEVAKKYEIPLEVYHNYCVELDLDYGNDHVVDKCKDAADFAIINHAVKGDIICTNDYGLASLGIGKECKVINSFGQYLTKSNISASLAHRHMVSREKRRRSGKGVRGAIKDQFRDNKERPRYDFEKALTGLIERGLNPHEEGAL